MLRARNGAREISQNASFHWYREKVFVLQTQSQHVTDQGSISATERHSLCTDNAVVHCAISGYTACGGFNMHTVTYRKKKPNKIFIMDNK